MGTRGSMTTHQDHLLHMRSTMQKLSPVPPVWHGNQPSRSNEALRSVKYVYVRRDAIRHPLQPPYDGPFEVIARTDKVFTILRGTLRDKVSIDRLKPAILAKTTSDLPVETEKRPPQSQFQRTRSGREVRLPSRFIQ